MPDFTGTIEIRYSTDKWGPYQFNFSNVLPSSDNISSATIKAYDGNAKPTSDLDEFDDITEDLLEPDSKVIIGQSIQFKLQWPGEAYKGKKITLVFELTLASGAKHPFFFQYVVVQ